MEPKSLLGLLQDVKLSSVIPAQQQVTVLEHNQTVGEALRVRAPAVTLQQVQQQ
jgi:hypothetical protein